METVLAVLMGISLSASCGFRVFVPMLVAGAATRAGLIEPDEGFLWIGYWAALIAFSVATVIEIAAYSIPWLDNALDSIASPLAVGAGILLSAAMMGEIPPLYQWSLAIIAGGGAAAVVQTGTVATRLTSTVTSGGLGNIFFTAWETVAGLIFAILSLMTPILACVLLLMIVIGMFSIAKRLRAVLTRQSPVLQSGIDAAGPDLAEPRE